MKNFRPDLVCEAGHLMVTVEPVDMVDLAAEEDYHVEPHTHVMTLGQLCDKRFQFYVFESDRTVVVDNIDAVVLEMSSQAIA